jgi:hypothetical protein
MNNTIKALEVMGIKLYYPLKTKKGIHFISSKTGRHYSIQPNGNIRGYSSKSSWLIGKGGIDIFLEKVYNRPKNYIGV